MAVEADSRPLVVVLTGPTGSGKSRSAMQLATLLPVEIVSVDSAQVFRGMDIGTAKPTPLERAQVPHHLIDIRDPAEWYSAGEFVRDARSAIDAIHSRGRIPLLVGGTMLYLRALLRGMATLPAASATLRAELARRAEREGWLALHRELELVDPVAAGRIHPNDPQRIQRALEVHALTGRPISEWQRNTIGAESSYRWLQFALVPADRRRHQMLLAERWQAMMDAGLPTEVQDLYNRGDLHAELPAVRAVGYRQLWTWCSGQRTLQQAVAAAVVATRQLAKRQLTWLRADSRLTKLDILDATGAQQVADIVRKTMELL
jgi:tRNA dimethylallyltransferase